MLWQHKRAAAVILAAFLLLSLSGCGGVPLGRRAIVKAIFVDWTGSQFETGLLVLDSAPSADAEQASSASLYCGAAQELSAAVVQAEQQQDRTPFYGQNQLLILGKGAAESKADAVLQYFGTEQAGRPGMAVFVSEMTTDTMKELTQADSFASTILQLEKEILEQPAVEPVMVYELPVGEDGVNGCIPRLTLTDTDASLDALVLYAGSEPRTVWEGQEMQLAQLMAGHANRLNCLREYDGRTVRFMVDSARIQRQVEWGEDGPCLHLVLTGTVRWLSASRADQQPDISQTGSRQSLSQQISQTLAADLQAVVQDAWNEKGDAFRLGWWFAVWDTVWYNRALQDGTLRQPERIEVEAQIAVL